jgi:formate/nitrite transporter FocA (FNT family)
LGFLIVIIGKQQLFTENTLTPIIPAMHNRDLATLWKVAKLWAIVLAANVTGAHLIAWFLSSTPVLTGELHEAVLKTASEATSVSPWTAFVRGIPAGWLIAMVVWLKAASESGEVAIIGILTYFIAAGEFTHSIAGSVEYLFRVFAGQADWFSFVRDYLAPVLMGNIIGGVTIVAALNHAQVVSEKHSS